LADHRQTAPHSNRTYPVAGWPCVDNGEDEDGIIVLKHMKHFPHFQISLTFGQNGGFAINPARDLGPRLFLLCLGMGWEVFRFETGAGAFSHHNHFPIPCQPGRLLFLDSPGRPVYWCSAGCLPLQPLHWVTFSILLF
jgi:hypothetical protein